MKCQKPFKYLSCEIIIFETREKKKLKDQKNRNRKLKKKKKKTNMRNIGVRTKTKINRIFLFVPFFPSF